MPPLRTMPSAAKPVKTERTHEENQERAYIAASRRSDRSLEARVESARRASEIHKRRTGRSLRVTEQDVVNEEMYEEEDDDLPMQYRRLTAHLQTSNADFDRRLAAYLTNHVAMRTALGQAVNGLGGQGYANAAQFANQGATMQQPAAFAPRSSMAPPANRSPTTTRHSPYPIPQHHRSSSVASPGGVSNLKNDAFGSPNTTDAQRRGSMPQNSSNSQLWNRRSGSIHNLKLENFPTPQMQIMSPPKSESSGADSKITTPRIDARRPQQQIRPADLPSAFDMSQDNPLANGLGAVPFDTTLPLESQQLLGGAFSNNDPMTAMLMGNFDPTQPMFSDYGMKGSTTDASLYGGMNQTLAPGFLDTSVGGSNMDSAPGSAFSQASPFATSAGGFGTGYDQSFDAFKGAGGFGLGLGSGEVTPSADWQNFIDGNAWDETQQAS